MGKAPKIKALKRETHLSVTINGTVRYVPKVKAKRGELSALAALDVATAQKILPVFMIQDEAKTFKDRSSINDFSNKLARAWPHRAMVFLPPGTTATPAQWVSLFKALHADGCRCYPCIPGGAPIHPSIDAYCQSQPYGFGLNLTGSDLNAPDAAIAAFGKPPASLDVVMDMGDLTQSGTMSGFLPPALAASHTLQSCRTAIVCGGSFPVGVAKHARPMQGAAIDRYEWAVFQACQTKSPWVVFGDYLIDNPQPSAFIVGMQIPAAIRYTIDSQWMIVRGNNMKDGGSQTIPALCRFIVGQPFFSGPGFSQGDADIEACSRLPPGSSGGNAETLRRIGVSHHITFVASQV